jgi:hypothetical protein
MKISMTKIKKAYPRPCSCMHVVKENNEDSYCVLGALSLYLKLIRPESYFYAIHFPNRETGIQNLIGANPKLTRDKALKYVNTIITYNDSDDIKGAWKILKDALREK